MKIEMSFNDAQERLQEMKRGGESVEFINEMAEVRLSGVFNVNDLEALYVLMLSCDPPTAGDKHE